MSTMLLDDDKRIHTCAKVGPWHILFPPVENTTFFVGTISSNGALVGAGYIVRRITTQVDVLPHRFNFSELNSTLKLYIRDYR